MAEPTTIVVIGAGIIGLTTALRLLDPLDPSKFNVTIVAQEWPTSIPGAPLQHSVQYASMWAGAHVRPIPAGTPQLTQEAAWLKRTVRVFDEQCSQSPFLGVTKCKGTELLEAPPVEYAQQTRESFTSETGLANYRKYEAAELPAGVELGFEYDTFCVNPPVYCANLLRLFIVRGGRCLERRLTSEWEAYDIAATVGLVINASGMGFNDPKCFPTRGQTVLTDLDATGGTVTRQNKDGSWSFIIPRFFNGGTVIGGTKQPRDSSSEPDLSTRASLLTKARTIENCTLPSSQSVDTARVIADIVGLRPTREGGMRIETEQAEADSNGHGHGQRKYVVHAYGAGGRGFEISWGVAESVVELVEAVLRVKQRIAHAKL